MPSYFRPHQQRHKVHSIQSLLPQLAVDLHLDEQAAVMAVSRLLVQALPESYQSQVTPKHLEKDAKTQQSFLVVSVPHGVLASELQLLSPALCEHLNTFTPQTGVHVSALKVLVAGRK